MSLCVTMFLIYRYVTLILSPVIHLYVRLRVLQGKEDPTRFRERFGKTSHNKRDESRPLIWLHGVSVGESVSLLSFIRHLSVRYPHAQILLTTGTRTAAQVITPQLPKGVMHAYAPLDMWLWVKRFLRYWKPNVVIFTESEVWPNILSACERKHIPIYLINGRLTEKSWSRWCYVRFFARVLFRKFTHIIAQSPITAARFKDLIEMDTASNLVTVMPNLKFAADPLTFQPLELDHLKKAWLERPVITAANTHEGEEDLLLKAFYEVKQHHPSALLVLVPRHPRRFAPLAAKIRAMGWSLSLRSQETYPTPTDDVFLFDTMGELGLVYAANPLVVLMGSFIPGIGGHNPVEPAQFGCCIVWGPWMDNAQDICAYLKDSAIQSTHMTLAHDLMRLLDHPDEVQQRGCAILDAVSTQKGNLKQLVHMCEPYLKGGD